MTIELEDTNEVVQLWSALTSGRPSYPSYVAMLASLARPLYSMASVTGDAGTHEDPVSSTIVPNNGVYRRVPQGYQRLASSPEDVLTSIEDAVNSTLMVVASFAELAETNVPAPVLMVRTVEYSADAGAGGGVYVADALATEAFAIAHPLFCTADGSGRYFRLLPDDRNMISVACAGAYGFYSDASTPDDIETDLLAATDDRAAINAAFAYGDAVGASYVRFLARHYACNRKVPTGVGTIYNNETGFLLLTTYVGAYADGACQVWRRKANGARYDASDFTAGHLGYGEWRGGGLGIRGRGSSAGQDPTDRPIHIHNVKFMLGCMRGDRAGYQDSSDKGFWQFNDRNHGHLILTGYSGAVGALGECLYTSAINGLEAARRHLRVERGCEFGQSNLSCLNPQGVTTFIDECDCHDALISVEGWTGGPGGYNNAVYTDCGQGTLQGGTYNTDPDVGGYYAYTSPMADGSFVPGHCGATFIRSPMQFGEGIIGRYTCIDCTPGFSDGAAFAEGTRNNQHHITSIVDTAGLAAAAFLGGSNCENNHIKIDCFRTPAAELAGFRHTQVAVGYGNYGGGNVIEVGHTYSAISAIWAGLASCTGPAIKFIGNINHPTAGESINIEGLTASTLDFQGYGPHLKLNCNASPASRSITVNLPYAGHGVENVEPGLRRNIANLTTNDVAGGVVARIPGYFFRQARDVLLGPGFVSMEVEYKDSDFYGITMAPPRPAVSVTWDPASIANGAQELLTVNNVYGAKPGDPVTVTFSGDRQGLTLDGYISADNTAKLLFGNMTGGAVDLASGTAIVEYG